MMREDLRNQVRVAVQNALVQVFPPGDHELIGYGTGIKLEQTLTALLLPLVPDENVPINDPSEQLIEAIREVLNAGIPEPWDIIRTIKRRVDAFELRTTTTPEQPE